jgi:hypothetical protein
MGPRHSALEIADDNMDFFPFGDPILAMLPDERPSAFDRLPPQEQMWRGRVFLMFFTISGGGVPYSWWQALRPDEDGSVEAFVATVPDEQIVGGLKGHAAMKRAEAMPPGPVQ